MLAQYADDVRALGRCGLVRQKGALSSFHIPLETINHRVWRDRYGGKDRGEEHCRLQRKERIALTRHAEAVGCKLIIDPHLNYDQWGERARRVSLQGLLEFLEKMSDEKCQVAIRPLLGQRDQQYVCRQLVRRRNHHGSVGQGLFPDDLHSPRTLAHSTHRQL